MSNRSLGTWVALGAVAFVCSVVPAWAESHVRIVRLSNAEGTVQVDRNSGQGFEKAFLNMPVVEGMKIATKADGRAEIEFEDGSTVRITPDTKIEFTALSLQDSGAHVSTVTLQQGLAYVEYTAKQKSDMLTLVFQNEKASSTEAVHFRVNLADTNAAVAVFNGDLKVDGPSGPVELSKNKTATFDFAANDRYTIAKNIDEDGFDAWDKQLSKYQREYASKGSNNNYPYGYGVSDLNYYGNYYNVPGYGSMWQPYFAGAGWSPFADGSWLFYPGFGYTWVSPYPWGWMPYRYGSWAFVPGFGWMWQPGFGGGFYNLPPVTNPPQRFKTPTAPTQGTATVVVGHPILSTGMPHRLTVQNGSAGMGVPRGAVNNLAKFSHEAQQNGFASFHTTPTVRSAMAPSPGFSAAGGSAASSSGSHMSTAGHVSSGGHTSSAPHR